MTVTVIALVTVNDEAPAALAAYLKIAEPLLRAVGGRIVQRFAIEEAIVGQRPARTVLIVEYPDRAAVDLVFRSAEYRSIIPFRDAAFLDYQVSIVENETIKQAASS